MELLLAIGISIFLLGLGWVVGRAHENAHLRQLDARENAIRPHITVVTLKTPIGIAPNGPVPTLLTGEVVIGSDYFKTWLSNLRNIFGGEMRQFTRLYMRARREALLRVMEQAHQQGYHAICNVRYDSCDINNVVDVQSKPKPMVACAVSATAYCTKPNEATRIVS